MADEPATTELGQPGNLRPATIGWSGVDGWEADPADPNNDLQFPLSAVVYDLMRTDGQVGAILRAVRQPLTRAKWDLDSKGVKAEIVKFVRENIGLPAEGDALPRQRTSKVVWKKHLREALGCLTYGFSVFEQKYEPVPAKDGQPLRYHLSKLGSRLPRTIVSFVVDRDGGLLGVTQTPRKGDTKAGQTTDVTIPVTQLVLYSREREGADWSGQSLLRTAYKYWLIKDAVLRISAQIVERNGMGIPIAKYDGVSVTRTQALEVVRSLRAGATAGVAIPAQGLLIEILGVTGNLVDPLPFLKYLDEAMSKAAMAMFLDLGHDAGARSLGDTFVDVMTSSLQSEGDFIAETFTEHVIRDLVEANWGVDEAYPSLTCGDLASQGIITAADLKLLIDAKVVTPDPTLEAHVRKQRGLPEADEPDTPPVDPLAPPVDPLAPPVDPLAPPTGPPDPNDPFGLDKRINQPVPPATDTPVTVPIGAAQLADYVEGLAHRARVLAGR